jgi:hypothetical protein
MTCYTNAMLHGVTCKKVVCANDLSLSSVLILNLSPPDSGSRSYRPSLLPTRSRISVIFASTNDPYLNQYFLTICPRVVAQKGKEILSFAQHGLSEPIGRWYLDVQGASMLLCNTWVVVQILVPLSQCLAFSRKFHASKRSTQACRHFPADQPLIRTLACLYKGQP